MRSQTPANVHCLRDFLSAEYSGHLGDRALGALIRECYREFLRQAHADPQHLPASLVQERLRQIAHEFLGSRPQPRA